jgi:hypothetical protein
MNDYNYIQISWQRVSEAIGDLADCFQNNLPKSRIEYVASSMLLQISKYMNTVMSFLDTMDINHPNHVKERRTAFNIFDIENDCLSAKKYNVFQVEILKKLRESCSVQTSFREDEVSAFAGTNRSRAKQVIGALKATKALKLKSLSDGHYSITLCPFTSYKIRKCGLTPKEVNALTDYINSQGSPIRNTLKTTFTLRNEEQHNRPIEFDISEERYLQVGEPINSSNLIEALPSSRVNLEKTAIFLRAVTDPDQERSFLYGSGISVGDWVHFGYDEPVPYGYRELLMPTSKFRLEPACTLNIGRAAISMSRNCCLMLSEECEVYLQETAFVFASGEVVKISGDLNQIYKSLPLIHKTIPVITIHGVEGTVDLRDIVHWSENLKKITMTYVQEKLI